MKDFIRQRLLEALVDVPHFIKKKYPERVVHLVNQIGKENKKLIDKLHKNIYHLIHKCL